MGHKMRTGLFLLSRGCWGTLAREIRKAVYHREVCYGFRRDLAQPFEPPPKPLVPVRLRPFRAGDGTHLFDLPFACSRGGVAIMDCLHDLAFIAAEMPACYVATTDDGSPCYIQWLISPQTNDRLQSYSRGCMPLLAPDEVLLEGAFIPFRYRGKKIMPFAMDRVAVKGLESGARFALTFVQESNLPSIKGVLQAGFRPYLRRVVTRRKCRTEVTFQPLPGKEQVALEAAWEAAFTRNDRSPRRPSLHDLPLTHAVSSTGPSSPP